MIDGQTDDFEPTLCKLAHSAGLIIHAYTEYLSQDRESKSECLFCTKSTL